MKTHLVIDSQHYFYDLYRIKAPGLLKEGDKLIATNHLNYKVCKVRVERVTQDYIMVELIRDRPTNVYWKLTKKDFIKGVYLIEGEEES